MSVYRRPGGRNLYVRVPVPDDLQIALGKGGKPAREIWRSTRCTDLKEAKQAAPAIEAEVIAMFEDRRRRRAPTPADFDRLAWEQYVAEADRDAFQRKHAARLATDADGNPEPLLTPDPELEQRTRAMRTAAIRKSLNTGDPRQAMMDVLVDALAERDGLTIQPGSVEYTELAHRLLRATLEGLKRGDERDAGDWSGEPRDPLVQPPVGSTALRAKPGETVLDYFDRFQREKGASKTAPTRAANRRRIELFCQFVGPDAHISVVTREAFREWKAALLRWPTKATEMREFRGMTFREIIDKNATLKKPTIGDRTINQHLYTLSGFMTWLGAEGFIEPSTVRGMAIDIDTRKQTRFPYSGDELQAIFSSPLFTGYAAEGKEHLPGTIRTRDWRYWIPFVAIYSGCRLGEIAQLFVEDIKVLHGTPVMHITDLGGDGTKRLKTDGSARVIPIHSKLVALGFLDYVEAMRKRDGKGRVFPEIKLDSRGTYSGAPSGWLNAYLRRIGVKSDASKNVHSLRHGVADALRQNGVLDELVGLILGHVRATTTQRYGTIDAGTLAQRVEVIEKIEYLGVELVEN